MKWFYIHTYCCTTSNKTEKLQEYETGQSIKLDIKKVTTRDSKSRAVQAGRQKWHHGVRWLTKCKEHKNEWEGAAGVKIKGKEG